MLRSNAGENPMLAAKTPIGLAQILVFCDGHHTREVGPVHIERQQEVAMSITFINGTSRVVIAARTMILATVIALAASVFGRHPAKAYEAPWCAVISEGYWDCQYRSIEECRPNILAGNRGWCNPSPYFVARLTEDRRFRKRRARAQ
jgi:Protein of unknown function (DUF3551)